jgi:hypothetical protein
MKLPGSRTTQGWHVAHDVDLRLPLHILLAFLAALLHLALLLAALAALLHLALLLLAAAFGSHELRDLFILLLPEQLVPAVPPHASVPACHLGLYLGHRRAQRLLRWLRLAASLLPWLRAPPVNVVVVILSHIAALVKW